MTLLVTEDDVKKLPLSIKAALPIVENTFRLAGQGAAENPPRWRMPFRNRGFLQFGPARLPTKKSAGFKLWANFGESRRGHGWDFLFDMESGDLVAIIQSYTISKYRTSAASAIAVKHLSREDASVVGIYSSGRQAEGQLEGICAVRPIRRVQAYSRNADKRTDFCKRMTERLGIDVVPVSSPERVPDGADIIVTVTNSEVPVLMGEWIRHPALIVAAGANHWYKRELDLGVVERAKLIVVDEMEQAKVEGGNLLYAIAKGVLSWDRVEELGDVVNGRVPVPDFGAGIILFESHGLAINDIAIAAKTYELARKHNVGTEIKL